jgi:hypothetical protein
MRTGFPIEWEHAAMASRSANCLALSVLVPPTIAIGGGFRSRSFSVMANSSSALYHRQTNVLDFQRIRNSGVFAGSDGNAFEISREHSGKVPFEKPN